MINAHDPLLKPESVRASGQQKRKGEAPRIAAKLAEAVALHQQGQLDQAQLLYQEILQGQPKHFDALQLLAMTEAQKNNPAAAQILFERALTIHPDNAVVLSNQATVLLELKRYEEALQSCARLKKPA